MNTDPQPANGFGRSAAFAQVGLEMVAPTAVGLWIDYHYDTLPWATATGAVLGFLGGLVHIFALLKRFEQSDARKSERDAK